jgi:hypothetical protein
MGSEKGCQCTLLVTRRERAVGLAHGRSMLVQCAAARTERKARTRSACWLHQDQHSGVRSSRLRITQLASGCCQQQPRGTAVGPTVPS